jgi:hypothetical protein
MLLMHSDSSSLAEDVGEEGAATIGEERGIQGCAVRWRGGLALGGGAVGVPERFQPGCRRDRS